MRKATTLAVTATVIAALAVASAAAADVAVEGLESVESFAAAQALPGAQQTEEGAVVVKGRRCAITSLTGERLFTFESHGVLTPSGNAVVVCRAETDDAPPEAVVVTGGQCRTLGGLHGTSRKVFTPSGEVILICLVNPSI